MHMAKQTSETTMPTRGMTVSSSLCSLPGPWRTTGWMERTYREERWIKRFAKAMIDHVCHNHLFELPKSYKHLLDCIYMFNTNGWGLLGHRLLPTRSYQHFLMSHKDSEICEMAARAGRVGFVGLNKLAALCGPVSHHAPFWVIPKGAVWVEIVLHLQKKKGKKKIYSWCHAPRSYSINSSPYKKRAALDVQCRCETSEKLSMGPLIIWASNREYNGFKACLWKSHNYFDREEKSSRGFLWEHFWPL